MPISKFKFVSPGVQIAEIDNSQLPAIAGPVGPVIIGRAQRGPGLRPVQVDSMSEFVQVFGNPQPGGLGNDVWRNGGAGLSPTYGAYAAQAYLRNNSPITFVRLLGKHNPDRDGTAASKAGWAGGTYNGATRAGGAYGLFIASSGSTAAGGELAGASGTLGAIFYLTAGSLSLKGKSAGDPNGSDRDGALSFILGSNGGWKLAIRNSNDNANIQDEVTFNFTENSKNYIRKVFNTNPSLTNGDIHSTTKSYWLGESFDRNIASLNRGRGPGIKDFAILVPLVSGTTYYQADQQRESTKAESPFVISQDLAGLAANYNYQKLFRFRTLDAGEWESQNFKISIADIKASTDPSNPYGTFTVELRMANDSDSSKKVVERFSRCDLNPNSNNYIAKKIGDSFVTWDYGERRYRDYGNYPNKSKYVYVDMNSEVDTAAADEGYLPFGWEGPLRWNTIKMESGSVIGAGPLARSANSLVQNTPLAPDQIMTDGKPFGMSLAEAGGGPHAGFFSASLEFPKFTLREKATDGNMANPKDAYFGLDTSIRGSSRFDPSYKDLVRPFGPQNVANIGAALDATSRSYIFTLEDLTYLSSSSEATGSGTGTWNQNTASSDVFYFSGSRANSTSLSITASVGGSTVSASWNNVLKQGFDSFTLPLWGGFDGLDITEAEPFRNTGLDSKTETTSYAFNSIKLAIDSVADPEIVESNLMSVPGITNTGLTQQLIKVCEDRADSLAVIDIESGYVPPSENTKTEENRGGTIADAITNLDERGLNSSYGCCYYPWVQARDTETGKTFWCPPSVAAIGTFSSAEKKSEVWFAPAGFTRGGLTEGSAGIPIVNVKQRLTSKQRDQLYEVNINPIASFPAEGIVIFGQKTLQTTPTALDRVNVRRLMIHLKKEISFIASRLLFDQNVQTTWDRFTGQVVPFLDSVKARLGLTDYKVILDETTTTPDLIDRNIMYAKIFLKPARAIEFIAIDFVITSTGASFED